MPTHTLTHRDLARLLGVSETTVKSYRSKFPTFLPVARAGKPVRLHPEALEVCRRIRQLFGDGLTISQTADKLALEFKEYPLNRRLSTAQSPPPRNAQGQPLPENLRELLEAQRLALEESARQASLEATGQLTLRIDQLEAQVRNLATLEAASKALVAELVHELRDARAAAATHPPAQPRPAPQTEPDPPAGPPAGPETVLKARRIVTVHGQDGSEASYTLGREPKPEPPLPGPARPPDEFLDLPAAILSDRGEFLGLPGRQSIARLAQALAPEAETSATWLQDGPEAWTCVLPLNRAQTRELAIEKTTTPRGTLVGLIRHMRVAGAEASPHELQEIFRQLRDQLG